MSDEFTEEVARLANERRDEIARLEAQIKLQKTYLDNKDSVISGLNKIIHHLEAQVKTGEQDAKTQEGT